jgi:NADPH-dependent stearoyl-CoA 9-desaturase
MLGTANFEVSPLLAISGGHLCYQIEHHLFPDLPSNRLPQISVRVRELCEKNDLPYNSASLPRQLFQTQRITHALGIPDGLRPGKRG